MKILIIHLSDIHLKESKQQNPILFNIKKIADAASSCVVKPAAIFVVVTGDIAFSGKLKEYEIAKDFFSDLQSKIEAMANCPINYVFVPGNHDCDFSFSDCARELILSNLSEDECDDSIIEQSIKVQRYYFDFLQSITGNKEILIKDKMFTIKRYSVNDYSIDFNLINSAWMSSIKEQQGKIVYPCQYIRQSVSDKERPASVSITLFHHPYPWYESTNGRAFKTEIEKVSDIILTGHEHDDGFFKKSDRDGGNTEYLEGDVLQESESINTSGFNIIILDLDAKQQEIIHFCWSELGYYKTTADSITSSFLRNINRLKNEFILQENFESKFLHDPGAQYSHPYKDNIQLDDIFIYPDLKRIPFIGDRNVKPEIIQRPLRNFFIENDHISIIGQEKIGKTSLAKMLFLNFRSGGFVCILINGAEIKGFDEGYLVELLKRVFIKEYSSPDWDRFRQLDFEKRVIIIDDYDKANLNAKGREGLIETLKPLFKHIVFIGGEEIQIKDLLTIEKSQSKLLDFVECNIMEFGYALRSELIEKWYSLSQDYYVDEIELDQKIIKTERIITSLLGKNFIPSYPIFILALIQQQDIQTPIKPSTSTGSYGYLYESLLTTALLKSSKLIIDLDTQYSYLSELAYFIFKNRKKYLSEGQAYDWHNVYCTDYSVRLDFSEILEYFINASVIIREDEKLSFRYSYLYYYFVGRYFRDHIGEQVIRDYILKMTTRLYQNESANILLFLCYLSKDPYILETIISTSKSLFSTNAEFNIITDTDFLYQAFESLPKVILNSNAPKENRRALLDQKDMMSADEPMLVDQDKEDFVDDNEDINQFLQINAAMKTVHIIGQILRNFHGSLKGKQKLELAQECYSLGMRVLKFIFTLVEENIDEILEVISEALPSIKPKLSQREIDEESRRILFMLMEGFTFAIIRHISDSLGHDKLALTFDEIIKSNNHISYRFIDLSVRLDYFFNNFPEAEVIELYKCTKKMSFPQSLLRHLVWYHFYIYPSKYQTRDRMCKKLGIELQLPKIYDERARLIKSA